MSSRSNESVGGDDPDALGQTRTGIADARTVKVFRREFSDWLNRHLELDEQRVADIVLAADEAMANCADHAYQGATTPGTMMLQIAYRPLTTALNVSVCDQGSWIEPEPEPAAHHIARGRGILLMRAVADACTIDGGEDGTTVCLRFYGCAPKRCA